MRPGGNKRQRGAYFTPPTLAEPIAEWAIRSANDAVLDPAAGIGTLLVAVQQRLRVIGGKSSQLYAVELHRKTFRRLRRALDELSVPTANIIEGDFFDQFNRLPSPNVVVMNPPFVRHQDVPPRALARMKAACADYGIPVGGMASSWAYFLLKAVSILQKDGRVAAILPYDLLGADYARDVLSIIEASFAGSDLELQPTSTFDGPQIRTVLLRAEGYSGKLGEPIANGVSQDRTVVVPERRSLIESWRPRDASRAQLAGTLERWLRDVVASDQFTELGKFASVRIGYVAGDACFHLTEAERQELRLASQDALATIVRSRDLAGATVTGADFRRLKQSGAKCWLFRPETVRPDLLSFFRTNAVQRAKHRTKCKMREPWWKVPVAEAPDALVVYTGARPRIIANAAGVHASNAFYVLEAEGATSGADLAVASMTSVAQIAFNLNGRELGGGLRKLHVRDIQNLSIPVHVAGMGAVLSVIDSYVRAGRLRDAMNTADAIALSHGLDWPKSEIIELQGLRDRYLVG